MTDAQLIRAAAIVWLNAANRTLLESEIATVSKYLAVVDGTVRVVGRWKSAGNHWRMERTSDDADLRSYDCTTSSYPPKPISQLIHELWPRPGYQTPESAS